MEQGTFYIILEPGRIYAEFIKTNFHTFVFTWGGLQKILKNW